jgi:hypothetical protein
MRNGFFNYPQPSKEKNQRSIDISDLFLTRFTAPWSRPSTLPANVWRSWVLQQPVAIVCRETLVATLLSLDWKITPRNSKYQEELEPTIRYYTKLLTNGGDYGALGLDYTGLIEWIAGDLLDTPFGGAAELGRRGNEPGGRVAWIRPLDAGTLYPTLNEDFPVVQMYMMYDAVAFPKGFISRTFMSPHSFLLREGWGMAPPEKVYFALELLNRGDKYYANLLLDIPTAGILDLGDMAKDAAEEWVTAFKTFVNDQTSSFRIPVLYEHNNPVEFISLGKVPNDIMFNQITMKYAALVAAAYGMSLSDIGLQTTTASGETLAGSIRQERRTKKTGFARIKAKIKFFFDKILPESLEFNFIDYDDELNVALGRARLASSTAFTQWRTIGLFSPQELRSQAIQDGLVSISLPDEIPPDAKPDPTLNPNGEPEMLQGGKAPSGGGEGEVKSLDSVSFKSKTSTLNNSIELIVSDIAPKIYTALSGVSEDEIDLMRSMVLESVFSDEDSLELGVALTNLLGRKSFGEFAFGKLDAEFEVLLEELGISGINTKSHVTNLKKNIRDGFSEFIGRAVVYTLTNSEHLLSGDVESLIQDVQFKIHKSLTEYVAAHVGMEVQKVVSEINQGQKELPEILRIKSIMKVQQDVPIPAPPVAPVINLPEITVNVPERESTSTFNISVPEQLAPVVNVQASEQPTPIVNVNVPGQDAPTINVNVPEQATPIVNLSVPEQATIVNVTNDVVPSKVEITNPVTVNVPKATREVQVIHRDQLGNIKYTDKDILYDGDKEE